MSIEIDHVAASPQWFSGHSIITGILDSIRESATGS